MLVTCTLLPDNDPMGNADPGKRRGRTGAVAAVAVAGWLLAGVAVNAGEADVLAVEAVETAPGVWRFDVTVAHDDAGWDHYADAWEVVAPDGSVLGTRVLAHPHDNEQPFTRSLAGVAIPPETRQVDVRARDSVHGFGGAVVRVTLERP